jgi:hypothetical protein
MTREEMEQTNWWKYSDDSIRDLMRQSFDLLEREEVRRINGELSYHDYSFVVFPAGKAYEGFLKKVFLDMKLITSKQYNGDHFRIGSALSPNLPKRYRTGWVFGKLINACKGEGLPMAMWEVWKSARNRIFHYFPQHQECITLEEAKSLVSAIVVMMDRTMIGCARGN